MSSIIKKNISELKSHPINEQIYTAGMSVEDLKESIQTHGQLTPITITSKGVIISGHRRVQALSELKNKTVNVIVKDYNSKEDEVMEVIAFNNHRKKTYNEYVNEIITYEEMWGKKQGQRTDLKRVDEEENGTTRKRIATVMGISEGNVSSLKAININAPHLLPFITSGEYSIHSAYEEVKKIMAKKNAEQGTLPPKKKKTALVDQDEREMNEIYTYSCKQCGRKFNQ